MSNSRKRLIRYNAACKVCGRPCGHMSRRCDSCSQLGRRKMRYDDDGSSELAELRATELSYRADDFYRWEAGRV